MSNINELKPTNSLNPFGEFCCTIGNLPSSYMASITYEEQLLWLCNYLKKTVIPTVNNNEECVKELQELYVKLKNYVDNYFNNLDVQNEINNKLDNMAETGELQNIIGEFLKLNSLITFNNIEEMKNSQNLIDGSFAQTLGFYELNDGGKSLYKIVSTLPDNFSVNNYNIFKLNNNLYAILINNNPFLNIKQFGAFENINISDYEVFNYAINYCRENNLILQLNKKDYLIDNTLNINIFTDKIEGNNANIYSNTTLLFNLFNDNTKNNSYFNNWTILKDMNIINKDNIRLNKCFLFDAISEQKALAHLNFKNINISNFNIGVDIFSNSYILTFENFDVHDCNKCFQMLKDGVNYGEKISIVNSTIYNSDYAIYNENNNGIFQLTNTSVDYNNFAFYSVESFSTIVATNCHFEGNYTYAGNFLANNCIFVFNKISNDMFLFYVPKQHHVINIINSKISGSYNKQFTKDLTEQGIIKFNNCKYIGGINEVSTQLLNNNSLELFNQNPLVWLRSGNPNEDQLQEGSLIKIEQMNDGNGFTVTKKANGSGDIDVFIKLNPNIKQKWRLEYELSSNTNKEEQIVITYDYGYFLSQTLNGQLRPLFKAIKGGASSSGYNLNNLLNGLKVIINNGNDTFLDSNVSYLRFHIWCNNMTSNSNFTIKNIKFQEM